MDTLNSIELTVQPGQLRSSLRAVLHAIFFHRTLDNVEPETYDFLDYHVASAPDAALERDINAKVDEFHRETVQRYMTSGQIAVVFLQRKPKKGWFAVTEELVPWEEHLITVNLSDTVRSAPGGLPPLHVALMQVLSFCAENKANVPPLANTSGSSEPHLSHQILISPPPPHELFEPSSPPRLTSPLPPAAGVPSAPSDRRDSRERSSSPGVFPREGNGPLGYLGQARDGLRAVGARAGAAAAGWSGRGRGTGGN